MTEAAVFPAPAGVLPKGMNLFVVEVPAEAACDDIVLQDDAGSHDRIPSTPRGCEHARREAARGDDR